MYGGLFGDLPSAKNSSKNQSTAEEATDKTKNDTTENAATTASTAKSDGDKNQTVRATTTSVVSSLGTAGTTMAFVPTTLRQRKRPATQPRVGTARKGVAPSSKVAQASTSNAADESKDVASESNTQGLETESISKHAVGAGVLTQAEPLAVSSPMPVLEEESDEFRQLHASVTDVYDPLVPNDLLAYWERKAMEKQRLELELAAKETLERQKRLREQLEQERQAVEATGDIQQIVQHRAERSMAVGGGGAGRGRGRGRGVSNLPAWLVQKQQDDSLGTGSNDTEQKPSVESATPSSSGRTVLLSNLTAPGEVDDELAEEVQDECEEACGKVEAVRIQDAVPPHQPQVLVYVTFSEVAHAEHAARLFQGRQFGQRRITAKLL